MNAITPIKTEVKAPFARSGTSIFINGSSIPLENLPIATFTIEVTPQGQLYFEQVPDLKGVARLYGDIEKRAERVMNTYRDRDGNTGVLLSGEKGSGKTLLARLLSEHARELGMPTIMLTKALPGDALLSFLKSVTQPYVLFIDEFEKLYAGGRNDEGGKQASLLSVFDGALATDRLTVVTCNDLWRISDFMRNRPGRFFYHFEYAGLDEVFVRDYCADNLKAQANTDGVVALSQMFNHFNFDMLQAVVEEMNRYGETANEVSRYLNVAPQTEEIVWEVEKLTMPQEDVDEWVESQCASHSDRYRKMVESGGVKVQAFVSDNGCAPLDSEVSISAVLMLGLTRVDSQSLDFHPDEIVEFKDGRVHYKSEENGELILARKKSRSRNYYDLAY